VDLGKYFLKRLNTLKLIKLNSFLMLVLLNICPLIAQSNKNLLFKGHPGVVSFTYRKQFEKDVPSTLDLIKKNGFTDMELSNLFGKTAVEFKQLLDDKGIKCSSFGVSYSDLFNKTEEVAQNAKILGAEYVRIANIPHKDSLTLEETKKAIEDFNRIGKILKEKYNLTFVYHNHGFEFGKYKGGTLYDLLVKESKPEFVSFELDILWAFFPGYDPAELLKKYGNRYKLIHLKDLKKGVKGNLSGGTPQDNDVALGTGQINIKEVIIAANKAGVKHFYIEDESSNIDVQVPESIKFLKSLVK